MKYMVVQGQLTGSGPYELICNSDRIRFNFAQDAIRHGLESKGHDDFWIATVDGDQLVDLRWMEEPRERDDEEWAAVATAAGLNVDAVKSA